MNQLKAWAPTYKQLELASSVYFPLYMYDKI